MLTQILLHTPPWVWALLTLLAALGCKQSRPGVHSLSRTAMVPLAMGGLSLYGSMSAFGATSAVLAAWGVAALPLAWIISRSAVPAGTRYDTGTRRFAVAGSWVPLGLMMAIFITKYVVGVMLAMAPARAHEPAFALAVVLLYGAFSGCFFGRSARLWRLALREATPGHARMPT